MRLPRVACLVVISSLSLPAAADITGKYAVEGRDAAGGAQYAGEAVVAKEGATYHVMWSIQDQMAIGTGILNDGVFAVTYVVEGANVPGIALYKVASDGSLSGQFTMLGVSVVGDESWAPAER